MKAPRPISYPPSSPPPSARPPEILARALERAALTLGMEQRDIAKTIGFSDASLAELFSGQRAIDPESKEGELAILFLRLYRSLDTLAGSEESARTWFHAHNPQLRGKPVNLVKTVEGLVSVIQYLEAVRRKS